MRSSLLLPGMRHTLLLLALVPGMLGAQVIQPDAHSWTDQWVFGINFVGGLPLGEFRTNEDGGAGVEFMTGYQPFRRQPLVIRAGFTGLTYGAHYARGLQRVCDEYSCWTEYATYQDRSHSMMLLHGGAELMATDGTWRPFAFALGGITMFRSTARLPASDPYGSESEENLFSSSNNSTAAGLGLRRVSTFIGREGGFEISARVTRNASASYVNEGGVTQQSDGSWVITPTHGAANLLGIQLGFWIGPRIRWNERR